MKRNSQRIVRRAQPEPEPENEDAITAPSVERTAIDRIRGLSASHVYIEDMANSDTLRDTISRTLESRIAAIESHIAEVALRQQPVNEERPMDAAVYEANVTMEASNVTEIGINDFLHHLLEIQETAMDHHRLRIRYVVEELAGNGLRLLVFASSPTFARQAKQNLIQRLALWLMEKAYYKEVYIDDYEKVIYDNSSLEVNSDRKVILRGYIFGDISRKVNYEVDIRRLKYPTPTTRVRELNTIELKY